MFSENLILLPLAVTYHFGGLLLVANKHLRIDSEHVAIGMIYLAQASGYRVRPGHLHICTPLGQACHSGSLSTWPEIPPAHGCIAIKFESLSDLHNQGVWSEEAIVRSFALLYSRKTLSCA